MPTATRKGEYRIPIVLDPRGARAGRVSIIRNLRLIEKQAIRTKAAVSRIPTPLAALAGGGSVAATAAAAAAHGGVIAALRSAADAARAAQQSVIKTNQAFGKTAATTPKVSRGLRGMTRNLVATQRASISTTGAFRRLSLTFTALGVGIGGIFAVNQIAKFEQAMASVRAVTAATVAEFEQLSSLARHLGAVTIFTAEQGAQAQLFLGRAGFTTNEILAALPDTLALARASNLELGQATDIVVSSLRSFGLAATETGRVVDVLARAASRSNTTIVELSEGIKFVAPVAAQLGIGIEEVAASLGKLADAGLKSTLGGTGLRRILSGLSKPTAAAKRIFGELDLTLQDLSLTTYGVTEVLGKLNDAGVDAGQGLEIFGLRGGPAFLVLKNIQVATNRLTEELRNSEGTVARMSKVMDDTLLAALKRLNSAITESFIRWGDQGLRGALRRTTETAVGVISAWNDMLPAMSAVGDTTIEQADEFQRLADVLGFVAKVLGSLGIGLLTASILKGIVAVGLWATALNPLVLALGAVVATITFANLLYKTHEERVEAQVRSYYKLEQALKNVAGASNVANLTFADLPDPVRERFGVNFQRQSASNDKLVVAAATNIGKELEKYLDPSSLGIRPRDLVGLSPQDTAIKSDAFLQADILANALRKAGVAPDKVASAGGLGQFLTDQAGKDPLAGVDLIETLAQNIRKEIKSVDPGPIGNAFVERFDKAILGAIAGGTGDKAVSLQDLRGFSARAGKLYQALESPTEPEARIPKLGRPQEVNELLQLERFDSSQARKISQALRLKKAGGEYGYDISSQSRILADDDTRLQFSSLPLTGGGQIDQKSLRGNISSYRDSETRRLNQDISAERGALAPDKGSIRALESELVGIQGVSDAALSLIPEVEELRKRFYDAAFQKHSEEGIEKLKEEFVTIKGEVDGISQATEQLNRTKALLAATPGVTNQEELDILTAYKRQLRDQLDPLGAFIRKQKESATATNDLSDTQKIQISIFKELQQLKDQNRSLTEQEIADTLEQALALARENQLLGDKAALLERIRGQQLPSEQANRQLFAAGSASESGDISSFEGAQQQAQVRLNTALPDYDQQQQFVDGFIANLEIIEIHSKGVAATIGTEFANAFNALGQGLGNTISRVLVYGDNLKASLRAVAQQFLSTIISSLVQVGIQMLITSTLGKTLQAQMVATTGAAASALTAAWSPPAVAANIATYGAAGAFGPVAIAQITSASAATAGAGAIDATAGFASGGFVSGPGGPREDAIPAMLSNGEFVVNAAATKRNREVLEAINAQHYQSGGIVTGGNSASSSVSVDVKVENYTRGDIDVQAQQEGSSSRILLVVKEALTAGAFDGELEELGVERRPE